MPRVLSYTPTWLSRPSPGFQFFDTASQGQELNSGERTKTVVPTEYAGPNRVLARRNTEIFMVVGKHVRWADLPSLKDQWQRLQETPSRAPKVKRKKSALEIQDEDVVPEDGSYRVLKPSIGEPIRQLCISPNDNLMAIVTSHTVHIAVLPSPDLLNVEHRTQPIKLKTYTIGPTTHVLSQSSIASVLWHPLGEAGNCLVTITTDSVVRLWEFDPKNRWSADSPALAIDLKRLVNATSGNDNVTPSPSGRNKVFTSDAAGMETASGCFGGAGYGDESPWSSMTLWIAMTGGDIYALCPLLPTKWQPPTSLLPTLSSAIVEKAASEEEGGAKGISTTPQDENQLAWISDIDKQGPILTAGDSLLSQKIEVFKRPSKLSPIPRLQGPFQMSPESIGDELEISDIYVIAAKIGDEGSTDHDSSLESDSEVGEEQGLSATIVCLMTREGQVYVCLDLEGVEAQWLPQKVLTRSLPPTPDPYLVVLEVLDTLNPGEPCLSEWPAFSQDVGSRYSFFTTHSRGVYYFSFHPWLHNLEKEFQSVDSVGMPFRIQIIRDSPGTLRERILTFDQNSDPESEPSVPACITMQDSELGYFLLTALNSQAHAAMLDKPYPRSLSLGNSSLDNLAGMIAHAHAPTRSVYQPSPSFYARSCLPTFIDTHVQARHRRMVKEEIRLSMVTLDLMTEAHRVLSRETHQLGVAASQLFVRCQTLQDALKGQILLAGEVARRTDQVTGEDPEGLLDGIEGTGRAGAVLEDRIEKASERQRRLAERCEKLRRGVKKIESRELSEREKAWKVEVEGMIAAVKGRKVRKNVGKVGRVEASEDGEVVLEEEGEEEEGEDAEDAGAWAEASDETDAEYLRRYREVKHLKDNLIPRAKDVSSDGDGKMHGDNGFQEENMVPSHLRRKKAEEIRKMLDHEYANPCISGQFLLHLW
ncbi:MAG: hypothetical protein Q9163_005673 [Psora crenata]